MSVFFYDAKMQAMRQLPFYDVIVIGPEESTFSYVTSMTFLSLELVIIGRMVLELRTKDGGYAQQGYSETKIWKISHQGICKIRKIRNKGGQPDQTKLKHQQ